MYLLLNIRVEKQANNCKERDKIGVKSDKEKEGTFD